VPAAQENSLRRKIKDKKKKKDLLRIKYILSAYGARKQPAALKD